MPVAHWGVLAILLACVNGAGAILVEVMTERLVALAAVTAASPML
jgi:hypothetical protein